MAYDASKEKAEELALIDKNNRGDKIRVAKITTESGDVYFDIRNMFTADNGELRPTQKGVRFSSELAVEILSSLLKAVDEVDYETIIGNMAK